MWGGGGGGGYPTGRTEALAADVRARHASVLRPVRQRQKGEGWESGGAAEGQVLISSRKAAVADDA